MTALVTVYLKSIDPVHNDSSINFDGRELIGTSGGHDAILLWFFL
jgi:hypothetical protein